MSKKDTAPIEYIAVVGLTNDETGKHFNAGQIVPEDAFPESVNKHWLKTGKLKPKKTRSHNGDRKD